MSSTAEQHQDRGAVGSLVDQVKPHLRGWLHLGMVPVAVASGALLVALATPSSASAGVAALVFAITAVLLFGTSALYHRGRWSPRVARVLKRWDHANIFLIIAGTYTPFAVLLLPPGQTRLLLWVVWSGALAGVLFRVFWIGAPRWLYTGVYIALGWVAIFFLVPMWRSGGPVIVGLIGLGGLCYTLGAVVYALRRPNPSPRWFGFHEVFHAFTIAAFAAHWLAAYLSLTTGDVPAA
ncbi:PAQR family membrane homeostasis protein TrhA [Serinicoccus kebangsaanensis]|uniref:PAQR family membrane homeostasis protein TrhA n=1 Tax=Serinicoccus kebangsaanensis TaxID=2602069 RepID=UPI00124CA40B|nr:hemolysin III family protein [Serinicoccus kebangsaanensis]